MVCIGGAGQGCYRRSNGKSDSNSNVDDDNKGRGMGGSFCNARTRSESRSRSPWNSNRKRYIGTADLGALRTRLRSGSRSGSESRLRRRRLWGERGGISGGGDRDNDDGDNDNSGNIGVDGEDRDYGGEARRGSSNCNGNIGSVECCCHYCRLRLCLCCHS